MKTLFLLLLTLHTFLKLCISLLPLFKLSERHHPSLPPTPPPPPHLYVRDRPKTRAHTKALSPANSEDSCMYFRMLCCLWQHSCRSMMYWQGPERKAQELKDLHADFSLMIHKSKQPKPISLWPWWISWCSCRCWNTKYSLRATPCTAAAYLPPSSSPWKLDGFRLVLCTDSKSKGLPR